MNTEWIAGLCADDGLTRVRAAQAIYSLGVDLAESATRGWWTDKELASLCRAPCKITVGLAVYPATFAKIRTANGDPALSDVPPEQDAVEFELHFANGVALDVLTTRDSAGEGAIARYLRKQNEGIQQVEYLCADVDRATAILEQRFEVKAIYANKRLGAEESMVNFFLVNLDSGKKILIELYELR